MVKIDGGVDTTELLKKSANLSDLTDVGTARTNLGLGSAALSDSGDFDAAGTAAALVDDLSGVTDAITARTNLGLGSAAIEDASSFDAAGSAAAAQAAAIQRANHTGTQTADTISDFDTEVSNNADVTANTSARHTHANQAQLDLITDGDHDVRMDNPHAVTAAQVGALAVSGGQLSGNLGIGKSAAYTLDVNGTAQSTAQRIVGSGGSILLRDLSYTPTITMLFSIDSAGAYIACDTESKYLRFYTRPTGGSRTERMRILDTGRVGINTTSISSQLHIVSGNASTIGQIIQLPSGAAANTLEVWDSAASVLAAIGPAGNVALGQQSTTSHEISGKLKSSTTANTQAARVAWSWNVSTHASRSADLALYVSDYSSEREGIRLRASGTAVEIGVLGATPIARQSVAVDATDLATAITLVNDIKAKLQNFGFFN